jgi:hypothetical protein
MLQLHCHPVTGNVAYSGGAGGTVRRIALATTKRSHLSKAIRRNSPSVSGQIAAGMGPVSEYKMAQASHLRLTLATARFELVAGWRDLPKPSRTVAQATIPRSTANTIHHFCPPPSQLGA